MLLTNVNETVELELMSRSQTVSPSEESVTGKKSDPPATLPEGVFSRNATYRSAPKLAYAILQL